MIISYVFMFVSVQDKPFGFGFPGCNGVTNPSMNMGRNKGIFLVALEQFSKPWMVV